MTVRKGMAEDELRSELPQYHALVVRSATKVTARSLELASNLAVIGRYILRPSVLRHLNQIKSGAGGEIQLTDAIARDIGTENTVYGYRFRGQRFDCGSKAGFLQATVAFALARDDLREDLSRYLREMVQIDKAAE